ncbi:hypothetical protein NQ317_009140 [Molorchus minor]|uniref:Uncharacterized protein n=1 Tax=Molorchus minor TaxID=1323400 RepID=A0ABQ9K2H8_9CUCU|nr:hypothetical protein NQ317_009140 [Molorchus minor]
MKMSYMGSPYSNSYNQDYDYEDDKYDEEEDRENDEPREESDEDTEDASETDTGRQEEPLEIKEQMYQDKLANLKKKLQQLKDGMDPPRVQQKSETAGIPIQGTFTFERIIQGLPHRMRGEGLYPREKAAVREFEEKKIDLKETLISDLEDKKRTIEAEKVKPVMTRKLRRRPNDPIPIPEKRRKPPTAQITYLLDEKDVEN